MVNTLTETEHLDWDAVVTLLKKRFQDDTTVTVKYRKLFDWRMESGKTEKYRLHRDSNSGLLADSS